MRHLSSAFVLLSALAIPAAHADTATVSAVPTFTLTPSADTLAMDAGSTTFTIGVPFVIQTGTFGIGHSGDLVATVPFSFMEDITINGITEDVTVTGQDLVAIEVETIEFNALGPISFGSESLSIEAYSIGSPTLRELPVELTATVSGPSPVPEPSSIALFGSGALGLVGIIRRRVMV